MDRSHGRALSRELIEDYRVAMTRTDPDDFAAIGKRVEAARRLAHKAFKDRERNAWLVAMTAEWRLQKRNQMRPTEPGDVHVLDVLYRVEESNQEPIELTRGLTPMQFCQKLSDDCYALNAVNTPIVKFLASGEATHDDWRYFAHQFVPPAADFCRMLAITAVRFPLSLAVSVYDNLYEEAGEGEVAKAHANLLFDFARQFGVKPEDELGLLDYACPEIIANTNAQLRMLWHHDLGWSLGSNFLMERLLPPEMTLLRQGLQRMGVKNLTWFDVHIESDEHHAGNWLKIVEEHLTTFEAQHIAYAAAIDRGRWNYLGWIKMYDGFQQWKATGEAPRLPARELVAETGQ